jgi:hypothetical protein
MTRSGLGSAAFAIALFCASGSMAGPNVVSLSGDEREAWLQHVIPLPQRVDLRAEVALDPSEVAVIPPELGDEVTRQAVRELREALHLAEAAAEPSAEAFALRLQIGGAEATDLRNLRNADQAYRIFPEPGYAGLRLVALTPRGLYYAAKTLNQLIAARATEGRVEIPFLRVTDWPDIGERGLWGGDAFLRLRWLADRKLNICEQLTALSVDEQGRGHGGLRPTWEPMVEEGPRYGIRPLPAIVHLNQLGGKGLFEAYPELKAQGGDEGAICYSQPAIVGVLADWIVDLGSLPDVTEVSVWLTENLHGKGGCQCAECRRVDRNVLETRVVLQAWKQARERLPEVGLRILLSEETYRSNELILQEVPWDVKVTYYHSLLTYTVSHEPMVYPLLEDYARRGRWLGVTPQFTAFVGRAAPFTGAHFIHQLMNEFADKGIACFTGYAIPRLQHAQFNVEAAAEWGWNAKGRTPREFALSYAVRHGIGDPERFAEWSEMIGPVEWHLYGSEWPAGELRRALKPVAQALREGALPELGEVQLGVFRFPWADYTSPEQLAADRAATERAVTLARELGDPEFVHESLAVEGLTQALAALWELKSLVGPDGVAPNDRERASRHFGTFAEGCAQAAEAITAWALLVAPETGTDAGGRYWQVVEALQKMADDVRGLGRELGLPPAG